MHIPDFLSLFLNMLNMGGLNRNFENGDTGVCQQQADPGPCPGSFPRFWHNSETKDCEVFMFGGCGGNENNFFDKSECMQRCGGNEKTEESVQPPVEKPADTGNICQQPKEVGPCPKRLPRVWFNDNTNDCEMFYYGGCSGNENNFEDMDACRKACVVQKTESEPIEKPKVEMVDASTQTEDQPADNADICSQPKQVGTCMEALQLYWYNKETGKCEDYLGCNGNGNSFKDEPECVQKCSNGETETLKEVAPLQAPPVEPEPEQEPMFIRIPFVRIIVRFFHPKPVESTDDQSCAQPCAQPLAVGTCDKSIPKVWYNFETGSCEQFQYSGCEGNQNNFDDENTCKEKCMKSTGTETQEMAVPKCAQPMKTGPCRSSEVRYWYNNETKECEEFQYGGCYGNENNFVDKSQCIRECALEGEEGAENDTRQLGFMKTPGTNQTSEEGSGSSGLQGYLALIVSSIAFHLAMHQF